MMIRNTTSGMRVRDVWFNGKRWSDACPRTGPMVGRHVVSVRRDSARDVPRVFGSRLARILSERAS